VIIVRSEESYFIVSSYIDVLNLINILIIFVLGPNDKITQTPCSMGTLKTLVQLKSRENRYSFFPYEYLKNKYSFSWGNRYRLLKGNEYSRTGFNAYRE